MNIHPGSDFGRAFVLVFALGFVGGCGEPEPLLKKKAIPLEAGADKGEEKEPFLISLRATEAGGGEFLFAGEVVTLEEVREVMKGFDGETQQVVVDAGDDAPQAMFIDLVNVLAEFGVKSVTLSGFGRDGAEEGEPADGASDGEGKLEKKVRSVILPVVMFTDATANEAVEFFRVKYREATGDELEISVSEDLGEKTIDLVLRHCRLSDGLRYVAEQAGGRVLVSREGLVIDNPDETDLRIAFPGDYEWWIPAGLRERVRKIESVRMELDDASLEEAVDHLRRHSRGDSFASAEDWEGVNFVVTSGAKSLLQIRVTVHLEDSSLDEAIKAVADSAGLRYRFDRNAVVFFAP